MPFINKCQNGKWLRSQTNKILYISTEIKSSLSIANDNVIHLGTLTPSAPPRLMCVSQTFSLLMHLSFF